MFKAIFSLAEDYDLHSTKFNVKLVFSKQKII